MVSVRKIQHTPQYPATHMIRKSIICFGKSGQYHHLDLASIGPIVPGERPKARMFLELLAFR